MEINPRVLRVALAQLNPTVGDLEGNTRKIVDWIDRAREAGADLVAFPELVLTGYPPEDLLLKPSFIRDNLRHLEQVVAASKGSPSSPASSTWTRTSTTPPPSPTTAT